MRPQAQATDDRTLYHYIIVRADLPHGVQVAQTIHAAGESCEGPLPSGTYAIALSVRDERELREVARRLWDAELPHKVITEPDSPYDGQAMAIGLFPTRERDRVRRVTSSLRLVR
jgi:Peptidyl-tRNA hydrolase PTH2